MLDRFSRSKRHYAVKLIVPPAAVKDMVVMSPRERDALIAKAEAFAASPFGQHPSAQPLKGRDDVVRIRQGDWRAVCRIDREEQTVIVDSVAHRREVYRR
jgi:mRNA-degrading endonuclease RelE of RelBE toxin-antitoxin system